MQDCCPLPLILLLEEAILPVPHSSSLPFVSEQLQMERFDEQFKKLINWNMVSFPGGLFFFWIGSFSRLPWRSFTGATGRKKCWVQNGEADGGYTGGVQAKSLGVKGEYLFTWNG